LVAHVREKRAPARRRLVGGHGAVGRSHGGRAPERREA
jgi:hypothetical protein